VIEVEQVEKLVQRVSPEMAILLIDHAPNLIQPLIDQTPAKKDIA
jgi:hypothetical protein